MQLSFWETATWQIMSWQPLRSVVSLRAVWKKDLDSVPPFTLSRLKSHKKLISTSEVSNLWLKLPQDKLLPWRAGSTLGDQDFGGRFVFGILIPQSWLSGQIQCVYSRHFTMPSDEQTNKNIFSIGLQLPVFLLNIWKNPDRSKVAGVWGWFSSFQVEWYLGRIQLLHMFSGNPSCKSMPEKDKSTILTTKHWLE